MVEIDTAKYIFHTPEHYAFRSKKGLDKDLVHGNSKMDRESMPTYATLLQK